MLDCMAPFDLAKWTRHYDGHVREAALARAAQLGWPELYLATIERLNDWVPQVRQVARGAVLTLLPLVPDSTVLDSLPKLGRLALATREDHSLWLSQLEAAIVKKVEPGEIIKAIHGENFLVARMCFRIARTYKLVSECDLIEATLGTTNDVHIASSALNMAKALAPVEKIAFHEMALKSKFNAVRTQALRNLLGMDGIDTQALAFDFLLDRQHSVRSAARWHLKAHGIETLSFYTRKLDDGNLTIADARSCLAVLSTVGDKNEIALAKRYLSSVHPRIQASALLAWARLDKSVRDEIILIALTSDHKRVRELAPVLLKEYNAYIDIGDAVELALEKCDYRLAVLLARREPWICLTTLVSIWSQVDAASPLRDYLINDLTQWINGAANVHQVPSAPLALILASASFRFALEDMLKVIPATRNAMEYTLAVFSPSQHGHMP